MEDADKLMLRTLRDLDCDVPQEAVGLAELSTEQVREEEEEECDGLMFRLLTAWSGVSTSSTPTAR